MRCLIYPQPLPTPLPPPQAANRTGDHHGDGGQEDFSGFRPRQPADSPRHVAWKASARDAGQRPLLVKQFAGGAGSELQLDWSLTPDAAAAESAPQTGGEQSSAERKPTTEADVTPDGPESEPEEKR